MMNFDLSEMPSDPERLKGKLLELVDVVEAISTENLALAGQRDAAVLENEKLLLILAAFKRALFGRRSEKQHGDAQRCRPAELAHRCA